jgi:pyrroline-5-carboxylate reductase
MGFALLEGLAAQGSSRGSITVIEPHPGQRVSEFCRERGFGLAPVADAKTAPPDVLILAIKPQMLAAAAPALQTLAGPQTMLLSILAGKRVADLSARFPTARAIVRAMPNTPAAIGRGVTGAFANPATSAAQRDRAAALLGSVGEVVWVEDEALIDAVTAVSGSGPAYVFLLAECLAAAGVASGLPEDLAARLARATVAGAGELLYRTPELSPQALRENVTSPGGTTAAALEVLMGKDGMASVLERAVAAAKKRSEELSGG